MDSYILKRAHASQYRLELTNSPELAHIDKNLWRPPVFVSYITFIFFEK
jgi:hypothetical protein